MGAMAGGGGGGGNVVRVRGHGWGDTGAQGRVHRGYKGHKGLGTERVNWPAEEACATLSFVFPPLDNSCTSNNRHMQTP